MLRVYIPVSGSRAIPLVEVNGVDGVSSEQMQFNLLIELRAMNQILLDIQAGSVTQTVEQYRSDVVNETSNPPI